MDDEVWKDVVGYEGYYIVSNTGRIIRNERETTNRLGVRLTISRLEMGTYMDKDGYLCLGLTKDGVRKTKKAHRVVAESFICNENGLDTVNHIDGDKTNNNVSNLEWMSQLDNVRHSWSIGLSTCHTNGRFNEKHPRSRIIFQYSKSGEYISEFPSVSEAARCVGANRGNISMAALYGSLDTCVYGYKWSYEKRDKF